MVSDPEYNAISTPAVVALISSFTIAAYGANSYCQLAKMFKPRWFAVIAWDTTRIGLMADTPARAPSVPHHIAHSAPPATSDQRGCDRPATAPCCSARP